MTQFNLHYHTLIAYMFRNLLRFAITACFLSLHVSAYAQADRFNLTGYIRDSFTDAGIKDAKVYLLSKDSVILDSAKTMIGYSSGRFSFKVKRDKSFRSCIIKVTLTYTDIGRHI